MSWKNALVDYAKTKEPAQLPHEVLLMHNEHTLTIFDGFPKAKFHFLTLPRLPFVHPTTHNALSERTLSSLSSLIAHKDGLSILKVLKEASLEVIETIEDEMIKTEGFVWPISVGFHAVESMAHVHLHIISQDFVSEKLKNKKHWNSFNPGHGFFLHLDDLISRLENKTLKDHTRPKSGYEKLLKDDMSCFRCGLSISTIPQLKSHLEKEFVEMKAEAKDQVGPAPTSVKKRSGSAGSVASVGDSQKAGSQLQEAGVAPDAKKRRVE